MKDKIEKEVKKKVKREAKKQAKKAVKKHRKAIAITIAVIALVLIISIVALYVFKPDLFQGIIDAITSNNDTQTEENVDPGTQPQTPPSTPEGGELGAHLKPIQNVDINDLDQGNLKPILPTTDNKLTMTVVDVGQGDGIIIELPDERVMYIDGGCRKGTFTEKDIFDRMDAALNKTDKFKAGKKSIDYLMVTHADYDHILSLPRLFQNYEVKNICFPRIADIDITKTWHKVYDAAQAETYTNDAGEVVKSNYIENVGHYQLGGEIWKMDCYSFLPKDYPIVKASSSAIVKNKISPICILEYATRKIVLTGDATTQTEKYLLEEPNYFGKVDADVLKVGHHGARESTSAEFLNAIDAEYALISCAETDYGHPHKELLDRLSGYEDVVPDDDANGFVKTFITRDDGNVVVEILNTGSMNITSTKNASKNVVDNRVVITATNIEIKLYALITKEEDSEEQYTLNCA